MSGEVRTVRSQAKRSVGRVSAHICSTLTDECVCVCVCVCVCDCFINI